MLPWELLRTWPANAVVVTPDGTMRVAHRKWHAGNAPAHFADEAAARRFVESAPADEVTLSATGGIPAPGLCVCSSSVVGSIRFERWTDEGRVSHGYFCADCRGIAQTG